MTVMRVGEGTVGTVGTEVMIQKGLISLIRLKTNFLPPGVDLFSQSEALLGLLGNPQKPRLRVFFGVKIFSQDFFQKKDVVLGTTIRVSKPRLQRLRLSAVKPDSWAGFLAGLQRWTLKL